MIKSKDMTKPITCNVREELAWILKRIEYALPVFIFKRYE